MRPRSTTVGLHELRQNLRVCLVRVKKGQTLTVTEHGHPVAELRPPSREDQLHRLVAEGRVTAPRRPGASLPRPLKLKRPVSALLHTLRDDSV